MEVVTIVLSVLLVLLRCFLAFALYCVLRFLLDRASNWHQRTGGYIEGKDGVKVWKRKGLPYGWQCVISLLGALSVVLA